ncbi:aldose 1-epimerase family protein [Sphingomonas oligophenolica]|uniref:Aldose 1-epimerase family protein n=1 Tax=Sphingomonas oligophenolica TaxID=301154 RepID=A0ABU9Y8V6_9SPHN
MPKLIEIASGHLSAAINPLGAELTLLRDPQGRELMTDADPRWWTGHAPILFPMVGRANGDAIRIDGVAYAMKQHGFARHKEFELVAHEAARAVFRLTDNEETRAVYPFAFALEVAFTLSAATLEVAVSIENRGDAVMPSSFGFHPAFAWPLPYGAPRDDHRIVFEAEEPERLKEIRDGLIAAETRASPIDGRTLRLSDELFAADALVWDRIHSSAVTYGAPEGPQLDIAFPDTPKLGIWTRPGAHYICVEPWHGIADPVGFTGDFRDKPGVFEIAPRGEWTCSMSVTLRS